MPWINHAIALTTFLATCLMPLATLAEAPPTNPAAKVINFGVRPLALPSVVYTETMRRDRILRDELAKSGWSVRQHFFNSYGDISQHLAAGKLNASIIGDMPTVIALARYDMLAVAMTKHAFAAVVTPRIEDLSKLKGKRVGIVANSSAHFVLQEGLNSADLSERDVDLVEMKVDEMQAGLESGGIDAFATWEPFTTLAREKNRNLHFAYRGISNDYLVVSRKLVNQHPGVARHFIASLLRAHFWLKAHSQNFGRAVNWSLSAAERYTGKPSMLSKEQMVRIVRRDLLDVAGLPALPEGERGTSARLAKRLSFLQMRGQLPNTVTWQAIVGGMPEKLMEEVLRQPESYRIYTYDYEQL